MKTYLFEVLLKRILKQKYKIVLSVINISSICKSKKFFGETCSTTTST